MRIIAMFGLQLVLSLVGAVKLTYYVKHQEHLAQQLEARFWEVSTPGRAQYGQFLSHEEVARLQAPRREDVAQVERHLRSLGASYSSTLAGDKIIADVPASSLKLPDLGVAWGEAVQERLLPTTLRDVVDMVAGVPKDASFTSSSEAKEVRGPVQKAARAQKSGGPQDCLNDRAVPPCLRTAYGLNDTRASHPDNLQTVVVNEMYKHSDLATFLSQYNLPAQDVVKEFGTNTQQAQTEASLDVQYIIAAGSLVPTWWVYLDGHAKQPFDNWLVLMSNSSVIPLVHSLSVGEPEDAFASDNGGPQAITRMNNEMMALGARGASILFASGDSGYQKKPKVWRELAVRHLCGRRLHGHFRDGPH